MSNGTAPRFINTSTYSSYRMFLNFTSFPKQTLHMPHSRINREAGSAIHLIGEQDPRNPVGRRSSWPSQSNYFSAMSEPLYSGDEKGRNCRSPHLKHYPPAFQTSNILFLSLTSPECSAPWGTPALGSSRGWVQQYTDLLRKQSTDEGSG